MNDMESSLLTLPAMSCPVAVTVTVPAVKLCISAGESAVENIPSKT